MSSRSILCSVLATLQVCGCVLAVERVPAAPMASQQRGLRRVPLGLCEDYPEETRSLEEVRRDLALLEAARVDVLRISIGWDEVEPQRDRYDFAFWDEVVEMAGEAGVTLIPYVAYTPDWNSDGAPESFWKTPPRDVAEFGELMQLLAERYRGRVRSWELWNEPDNEDYWLGSAEQFAELVSAGADGVRAGDPDARVVLGGLAGGVDFLRALFDDYGVGERVDVVNLHGYYETWNPNPLETLPEYIGEVREIVDQHGGRQALWMAEVGYSNFAPAPGALAARLYSYEHTPEFQAVMLVRTLALLLSQPELSLIAWYELKDARPADAVIGDAHNRHLGVAFADYRPKPALDALAFMSELFGAGFRSIDRELQVDAAQGSHAVLRAFVTRARELVLVAWLPTHPLRASSPPPLGASLREDTRRELVHVSFPELALGPAMRHDATGQEQGELSVRDRAGRSELELELRGGQVQVLRVPIEAER
jgi:hypothetical protein